MTDNTQKQESTELTERENAPERRVVTFEVAGKKLEGQIVKGEGAGPFSTLLLGGGGNIPYREYYGTWQDQLATDGVTSMSFDFRGVGASDSELGETSLDTRLEDAKVAVQLLKQESPDRPIYIMGVSMGGTIAIQLANAIGADGLILVAPAAYSEEARHIPFGPDFSVALRKESSWEGSPDFSELEKFGGKVLLAYGDQDSVIPAAILQRYTDIVKNKGEVLVLPNVGHRFIREGDPASQSARDEVRASLETLAI